MKSKLKVYLDTSVISAYFDERNPERKTLTLEFFKMHHDFSFYISEITVAELNLTPNSELRNKMTKLVDGIPVLKIGNEDQELSNDYLNHEAIPEKYSEDALHIACAVLNDMDYLVSWNFKHIVKIRTKNIVKMVNTIRKLTDINIITPAELLD